MTMLKMKKPPPPKKNRDWYVEQFPENSSGQKLVRKMLNCTSNWRNAN